MHRWRTVFESLELRKSEHRRQKGGSAGDAEEMIVLQKERVPKVVGESTVQEQNTRKQTVLIIPMNGQKLRVNGIISVPIAI